jgi:hypothetical protein
MEAFTESELLRLTRLRARARDDQGATRPGAYSFAERYGIAIRAVPVLVGPEAETCYHCVLERVGFDEVPRRVEALFQVTTNYLLPPTADELLRWLAVATEQVEQTDLTAWGLLYGFTATGRTRIPPYRGLVRDGDDLVGFVASLTEAAAAFRAFLGHSAYAELVRDLAAC